MIVSSASAVTPRSQQQLYLPQQSLLEASRKIANSITIVVAFIIIIMFNRINKEIIIQEQSAQNAQETNRQQIIATKTSKSMLTNFIKHYFDSKALKNIPQISIVLFYEKIHKIRSIFVENLKNPKQYLISQYNIRIPVVLNDHLIHDSLLIARKIQSLKKQTFSFLQQVSYKKTRKIYFGQMAFGKRQGYGVLAQYQASPIYGQNGSHFYFYEGFFSNNQKNGLGIQWFQNRIFIGQFVNNTHFSHTDAIFLYNNGDIYVGSIFNYKRNGKGVLFQSKSKQNQYYKYETSQLYSDYENIVVGYWQNDQIVIKNRMLLTTEFKNILDANLYNFDSTLLITAVSVYVGDLKRKTDNLNQSVQKQCYIKEGRGFQCFRNGDIYKGEYLNNAPHGLGFYIWSNKDEYKGQFFNGKRQGNGSWKGSNGQSFEGEYKRDKRSGYGIYLWPNGNTYEGQFKYDSRDGIGKMSWSNGQVYLGKWKRGLQHGEGQVRISANSCSLKKKMIFQHGKPMVVKKKNTQVIKIQNQKHYHSNNHRSKTDFSHSKQKINQGPTHKNIEEIKTNHKRNKQFFQQQRNSADILKLNNKKQIILEQSILKKKSMIQEVSGINEDNEIVIKREKTYQQEEKKEVFHIKSSVKQTKKEKFRTHLVPLKKLESQMLGQTLLRPIKWSNFRESWQKNSH